MCAPKIGEREYLVVNVLVGGNCSGVVRLAEGWFGTSKLGDLANLVVDVQASWLRGLRDAAAAQQADSSGRAVHRQDWRRAPEPSPTHQPAALRMSLRGPVLPDVTERRPDQQPLDVCRVQF